MKNKYILWHDLDYDLALWVYENSSLKSHEVELRSIPKSNSTVQIVRDFHDKATRSVLNYIKFETPDIIIQKISEDENNPVICVTEFMTHTPQWQHPVQRFTRLYNSSILGTPTALVLPHKKVKLERGDREEYRLVKYSCSPSVYQLFLEATDKSKNPTLIFNWFDCDGNLAYDKKHPTSPYIKDDIVEWFYFIDLCVKKDGVLNTSDYKKVYNKMKSRAEKKVITDFDTIDGLYDTHSVITKYNLNTSKLSSTFIKNKETLVFRPTGLKCKSKKIRTDPYAGMLCAFDIMFCRDGKFDRTTNLVMRAIDVNSVEVGYTNIIHNKAECPFTNNKKALLPEHLSNCVYTQAKHRRIYGEVADVVIFDDSVYYNI